MHRSHGLFRSSALALAAALSLTVAASEAGAQPVGGPAAGVTAPAPATGPATGSPTTRVAIIDSRRVLTETEEGLRVQATLRKLFDAKQGDLAAKERQLQQEWDDLLKEEKQKGRSNGLDQRKADWKQKYLTYQQGTYETQKEFSRKENEMYGPMLQKINAIVKTIAAREGLDVVVEKQAVAYFRVDLDVTEKVIQQYNAGDTGAAKEPAKGKPAPTPAKPATAPKK